MSHPRAARPLPGGVPVECHDELNSLSTGANHSEYSRPRKRRYVLQKDGRSVQKSSRFQEFIGAFTIYALCISLPTIFGMSVRWYENYFHAHDDDHDDENAGRDGGGNGDDLMYNLFLFSSGQESLSAWAKQTAEVLWSSCGDPSHPTYPSCQMRAARAFNLLDLLASFYHFLKRHLEVYIEVHAFSDIQIIMAASILLSLVRVVLVHMLVPRYLTPRRLQALVLSKSTHMLSSSEYAFGNQTAPTPDDKNELANNEIAGQGHTNNYSGSRSFLKYFKIFSKRTVDSLRRALGHEIQSPHKDLDATQSLHLSSAPRYATAIFRLLFCTLSCSWALYQFSSANFWPIWVGGPKTAKTSYCWDLAGTLSPLIKGGGHRASLLDSDFNHENTALRFFFLGQASYQTHCLCFHFLSMILLLAYTDADERKDGKYLSIRKSLKSYSRPMLEHIVYFILTVTTYIFSGLRRLGAISIFALEMSSAVVQLLQICINAPEMSILRKSSVVKCVHRYLVVPVFVYCRFFILPFIVQYSAAFESSVWLKQVEHALAPGSAVVIYGFFNGMLLVAFGFNFIYLQRLLFHPYLKHLSHDSTRKKR